MEKDKAKSFFSAKNSFIFFGDFYPGNVRCGISTNFFADCNYYNEGGTDDGIKKISKIFQASETFAPFPENGDNIITATKIPKVGKRTKISKENGDAIIIRHHDFKGQQPLIIFPTGDCPIVVLHNKEVSALIHCGWRGLKAKILSKVADAINPEVLIRNPTKIIIWPGICQEHYPVNDDVAGYFPDNITDKHLDLVGVVQKELSTLGFFANNINIPPYCSFHSQKNEENIFSSHRRGDKTRNVVFMSINLQTQHCHKPTTKQRTRVYL